MLPKTDPFWATHTPPWDFNCNCSIEDCDDEEAQKRRRRAASTVSEQIAGKKVHRLIFKEQSGPAIAIFWRHGKSWKLDIIDTWDTGERYEKIKK